MTRRWPRSPSTGAPAGLGWLLGKRYLRRASRAIAEGFTRGVNESRP